MFARRVSRSLALGTIIIPLASLATAEAQGLKDAPVAPWSWTGHYLGVNVGYGWGDAKTGVSAVDTVRTRVFRTAGSTLVSDVTTVGAATAAGLNVDVDGWVGGGQYGHNWQSGTWIYGLEIDLQASGQKGAATLCQNAGCAGGSFLTADHKLDWFGTLRARAGVLIDPKVLVYATGGLAVGQLSSTYTTGLVGGASTAVGDDSTKAGWVIGAGVEGMIDRNWRIKLEYLYMDLGDITKGGGSTTTSVNQLNVPQLAFNTITDTTTTLNANTRFTDQILRVGLNYRLN